VKVVVDDVNDDGDDVIKNLSLDVYDVLEERAFSAQI
jgi:hypothetical protein